jgi:hypothetical protein
MFLHAVPAKIIYAVPTADMMEITIIWRMFSGVITPIALALQPLGVTPMMITNTVREQVGLQIPQMHGASAILAA